MQLLPIVVANERKRGGVHAIVRKGVIITGERDQLGDDGRIEPLAQRVHRALLHLGQCTQIARGAETGEPAEQFSGG